ncbi:hypothetical protein BH09GEM1_BH09GEM1_24770 [soil metagenome]
MRDTALAMRCAWRVVLRKNRVFFIERRRFSSLFPKHRKYISSIGCLQENGDLLRRVRDASALVLRHDRV